MVLRLALFLCTLGNAYTPDSGDDSWGEEEAELTKLMSCALLTVDAINNDPTVIQLISDSVHDHNRTLEKLTAEICTSCFHHISLDYANRILDEGLDEKSDPALIIYNQTKYLARGASLDLTKEEVRLMDLLVEVISEEEMGNWQDEHYDEDFGNEYERDSVGDYEEDYEDEYEEDYQEGDFEWAGRGAEL